MYGVAFSPGGTLPAIAGGDGTVRLWNLATRRPAGAPLQTGSGPGGGVGGVAFSPSGNLLASADGDGTVRLWNPAIRHPAGAPLPVTTTFGGVNEVAFSPDGKLLAGGRGDGAVLLWQVSLFAHTYPQLCADVGPPTPHEWNQYASGNRCPKSAFKSRKRYITQWNFQPSTLGPGKKPPRGQGRTASARVSASC